MPAEQNPRERSGRRPAPSHADQRVDDLDDVVWGDPAVNERRSGPDLDEHVGNGGGGEVDQGGDEADPGGVAAGEGEVIGGDGDGHVLVVERAGAADEDFDEADEQEVQEEAEEERSEERSEQSGPVRDRGEEESERDREEEPEIGGELQQEEKRVREVRPGQVVELPGQPGVQAHRER